MKHLSKTITSLLLHIQKNQESSGRFVGLSSSDKNFKNVSPSFQTFHTSLILAAIADAKDFPSAKKISSRGARYLLSQKSKNWSWNYWDRNFAKSKTLPDDLDDTAMALAALHSADEGLIDEKVMANMVNLLISAEESEGGPYNTWLLPNWRKSVWHDVDIAVNANIANFLHLKNITLPQLTQWIENKISKRDYSSKYYSKIQIIYFLSKWYHGSMTSKLIAETKKLLRKKNNLLDTALLTSALLHFGEPLKSLTKNISLLEKSAKNPARLKPYPFFVEEIKHGKPNYAGSSALTATCVVETLLLFKKTKEQETNAAAALRAAAAAGKIGKLAVKRFAKSPNLQKVAVGLITKLATKDPTHEIALLPRWFANSLHNANGMKNTYRPAKKFLNELGAINTLGWTGYTIVDKVLDGEDYAAMLPVANICIREVSVAFETMFEKDPKAQKIISDILDAIDTANFWENHHCKLASREVSKNVYEGEMHLFAAPARGACARASEKSALARSKAFLRTMPAKLPDYGNLAVLAEKSLGHALGPIAIILKSHTSARFAHAKLVQKFFTHYLIARQLNDDAHDWLDDLDQGFINSVSVRVLKKWRANPPLAKGSWPTASRPEGSVLDLHNDRESLQKIFWHETIDHVAGQIRAHATRARAILAKMRFIEDSSKLEALLTPLEQSAIMAIIERNRTVRFLKAYKKKT